MSTITTTDYTLHRSTLARHVGYSNCGHVRKWNATLCLQPKASFTHQDIHAFSGIKPHDYGTPHTYDATSCSDNF